MELSGTETPTLWTANVDRAPGRWVAILVRMNGRGRVFMECDHPHKTSKAADGCARKAMSVLNKRIMRNNGSVPAGEERRIIGWN